MLNNKWEPKLIVQEWSKPFKLSKNALKRRAKRRSKAKTVAPRKRTEVWVWKTVDLLRKYKIRQATSIVVQPMHKHITQLPIIRLSHDK